MELENALKIVKAADYRVSKPAAKKTLAPVALNAVGKPYGANYDPSYKMRSRPTSIARLAHCSSNFSQYLVRNNDPRNYSISGKVPDDRIRTR